MIFPNLCLERRSTVPIGTKVKFVNGFERNFGFEVWTIVDNDQGTLTIESPSKEIQIIHSLFLNRIGIVE